MPQFVLLMKMTPAGAMDADSLEEHRADVESRVDQLHGTMPLYLYTLGQYDVVAVVDLPSDEDVACLALRISQTGRYSTATMRAFTTDQAVQALGRK